MQLILYSGKDCHLCDRLQELIQPHMDSLREQGATVYFSKRDIKDNPHWLELYRIRIPVLTVDGHILVEGRPTEDEVERAFAELGN